MISMKLIEETEKRFDARNSEREATVRKLKTKSPLEIDEPERVEKRLARLSRSVEPARVARAIIPAEGVALVSDEPAAVMSVEDIARERILGVSDLLSVNFFDLGNLAARSVARVRIKTATGRIAGYGTGFMVSPRLMLTNNHVLGNPRDASFSQFEFNFQDDFEGKPMPTIVFELDPATFFITDPHLDYTLVAVRDGAADRTPLQSFGWRRLIEEEGKILRGEYASIIQHPDGGPKQLALRENQVIDVLEDFMHYKTDTAPGSSGSPVFNDQWEVVALHHSGVPKKDQQGRVLAVDGSVWTASMGEGKINWIANEGVRVSRIVRHIKTQNLTTTQRRLRSELLESAPPSPASLPHELITSAPSTVAAPQPQLLVPSAGGDDRFSLTVPLTISIQLNAPLAAAQGVTVEPASPIVQPSGKLKQPEDSSDLRDALAEFDEAKTKKYYDEEKDRKDRTAYYKGLDKTLSPAKFFDALSELLTKTHTNQPKYKPSINVYPWVDLQPSLKLTSIYSGKEFDAEEFIREDVRIDQERAARFQERVIAAEATFGAEQLAEELDVLEAQMPFNCEHSVCQSYFGKREPMRGDIHHLFACESNCNSFRGNTPYFDFKDFEEVIREECGKLEANMFEPSAGKGAAARANFYFLLRYPGEINSLSQEYDEERLQMLLGWHQDNPVTEWERHRNMAIFAVQGNRNPLIDFPSWSKKIDFKRGL